MLINIPPKASFAVLRFVTKTLGIWPLSNNERKWLYKPSYLSWFCLVNYTLLLLPTLYALYLNRRNIVAATYSWLEVSGLLEAMAVVLYNNFQRSKMKILFGFTEQQLGFEKTELVKQYATTYALVFLSTLGCYSIIMTVYFVLDKPPTGNEELIMTAAYPFKIDTIPIKIAIGCNQAFIIVYSTIIPCFDAIAVFLIFNCTDRLRLLEIKFRNAKDYIELIDCVQEHNNILRIAKETNYIVRFIALKTVYSFISCVFGSGLQILNNTAPSQCIHQICVMTMVYARIYLCAESAENLSSAGEDIEFAVYSTDWYNDAPKIVAVKSLIIHRAQKLPVISVNGVMSSLNRRYLGLLLYTTFSYLMTLRVVTGSK